MAPSDDEKTNIEGKLFQRFEEALIDIGNKRDGSDYNVFD